MPEDRAWEQLSNAFPAVTRWLAQHETKARKRYDQGQFWWELRPCDYYEEFEEEKIVYQEIAVSPKFGYDTEGNYVNNKVFVIPNAPIQLVGLLNSQLIWKYLTHTCSILRGGLAMQSPYIMSIPVLPELMEDEEFAQLVQRRISEETNEDSKLEAAVDRAVYALYGLSEAEVRLVAGGI